jgi:hypothetical protein
LTNPLRLMRKLLKKKGFVPKFLVTDKLRSYAAAFRCPRLTKRSDDARPSCSGSSQLDPPSASSVCTARFTTPSTFNATSSPYPRCGSSEP